MAFAPTNTDKIFVNNYEDNFSKDNAKLAAKLYKPETKEYAYEPAMPNRPMGTTIK